MKGSWAKTEKGWGVRIQGNIDSTTQLQGREVEVQRKDGKVTRVVLGRRLHTWNAGRTSIYEVGRRVNN